MKSNDELYLFSLNNGHLPKHTVDILKKLQKSNKLLVFDGKNAKLRNNLFYINYSNFKKNKKRANFKIIINNGK